MHIQVIDLPYCEFVMFLALCEGAMQKAVALRQQIIHTTVQATLGTRYILADVYDGDLSIITLVSGVLLILMNR